MENQTTFKKESLSKKVLKALEFIGVNIDDFNLKEEYFNNKNRNDHDPRHLYRTMIDCALIAQAVDKPREGFLAFCGAYIHDLALRDNGGKEWHGRAAVDTKWYVLEKALAGKYNLTEHEESNIKAAVVMHCGGKRREGEIENYDVSQILRVADALDRARFTGENARLNVCAITYSPLLDSHGKPNQIFHQLIVDSEDLYWRTHRSPTYVPLRVFINLISVKREAYLRLPLNFKLSTGSSPEWIKDLEDKLKYINGTKFHHDYHITAAFFEDISHGRLEEVSALVGLLLRETTSIRVNYGKLDIFKDHSGHYIIYLSPKNDALDSLINKLQEVAKWSGGDLSEYKTTHITLAKVDVNKIDEGRLRNIIESITIPSVSFNVSSVIVKDKEEGLDDKKWKLPSAQQDLNIRIKDLYRVMNDFMRNQF